MTNPIPPASPTSAEDDDLYDPEIEQDFVRGVIERNANGLYPHSAATIQRLTFYIEYLTGQRAPSPVARGEWPPRFKMVDMTPAQAATFLKNIAVLANSGDKWDAFEEICKSMIESAFNAGALRPPSPPAVVGKPTQQQIDDKIGEWFRSDANVREKSIGAFLLAAPIWPTAEPPKVVEPYKLTIEELHEMDKYQLDELPPGQRTGSGITRGDVAALVCRCVTHGEGQDWLTESIMSLITGKKG